MFLDDDMMVFKVCFHGGSNLTFIGGKFFFYFTILENENFKNISWWDELQLSI